MTRDVARLSARTFDLLVIGGGIYGLTIAADAAQRGLSVAVVERDDFGSGNTFNHLRTVHGGLRYLQTLDVARARESVAERRTIARIAPAFVRPLPFVLPLTSRVVRGPMMMRAGFMLDAVLAHDRNDGIDGRLRLPAGRVLGAAPARERFPLLRDVQMFGAAVWYDYTVVESDRLSLAWAVAAANHGAALANHVTATRLLRDGARVVGAAMIDGTSGRPFEVAARVVVNATGGDLDGLLQAEGVATGTPVLRAMNLVTRLPGGDAAIGAPAASGRALFMVPWRGCALFGTWESGTVCRPEERAPATGDVDLFVREVAAAFPSCGLTHHDVTLVHRGIVPAAIGRGGRVTLEGHQRIHDHAIGGRPVEGLISVAGVKFTTARAVAESVADRVLAKLGRLAEPCRTATLPLPGAALTALNTTASAAATDRGVPPDVLAHLTAAYGSAVAGILALVDTRPDYANRLSDTGPVIAGQIAWAARHEMAVTLADAVLRRTPLGVLGHPGRAALAGAAAVLAAELGWSAERTAAEMRAVEAFFDR